MAVNTRGGARVNHQRVQRGKVTLGVQGAEPLGGGRGEADAFLALQIVCTG